MKIELTEQPKDVEDEPFAPWVSGEDERGNCSGCHEYPCSCDSLDVMLHADWNAEIEAHTGADGWERSQGAKQ